MATQICTICTFEDIRRCTSALYAALGLVICTGLLGYCGYRHWPERQLPTQIVCLKLIVIDSVCVGFGDLHGSRDSVKCIFDVCVHSRLGRGALQFRWWGVGLLKNKEILKLVIKFI